ncbi:hypothetical protein EFY79_18880 [Hanamia caeni]|jgi:hypothetical protein|uniref:Uncharacterized protein n=1 Tax=Hanamia caeni TaxID=2294116 RepID=A0A3M9N6T4_9BACT|nr:hypothetical protein EFY79_18880 [Hanamia caeni]
MIKILMRNNFKFIIFLFLSLIVGSCKKAGHTDECFPGVPTIRQIIDRPAVIKVTATVNAVKSCNIVLAVMLRHQNGQSVNNKKFV